MIALNYIRLGVSKMFSRMSILGFDQSYGSGSAWRSIIFGIWIRIRVNVKTRKLQSLKIELWRVKDSPWRHGASK